MHTRRRQLVIGLVMLPLTLLPFVAYFKYTAEGQVLWTRATIGLFPPELPHLSRQQVHALRRLAPHYSGGVAVLVYHGIGATSDGEGRFTLPVSTFADQLASLRAAGMQFITAHKLAYDFAHHRAPPRDAVMITFDDGRADAMMLADPLLRAAHANATMFVITDRAKDPGIYYAGDGALRHYSGDGVWDLESHTAGLHDLQPTNDGNLPMLTSVRTGETFAQYRDRFTVDLARADYELDRLTNRRPVAFAYPFGAYGADRVNDRRIPGLLRRVIAARYQLAFQQDDQATVPLVTCTEPRTALRRLDVYGWTGAQLLQRLRRMVQDTRFDGKCPGVAPH